MIDVGILLHQRIQIRGGISRYIGIVVMEIVPMDAFQDQHDHPVVGRFLQCLPPSSASVLRLKSDYLAIATLGFTEIIRAIFQWNRLGKITNWL